MKIKLNTIFFSCFFTAAFLAELYCLLTLEADLFTIGGLGVVVLISLYLLLDSARSQWKKGKEETLLHLEKLYREEAEKREQRFTELLNIQKATYTSSKKNTVRLEEKLEELLLTLHSIEQSNAEALKRVVEYQKKLMEGQKNALNIEVNYNKENTKAIIAAIREEADRLTQEDRQEQDYELIEEEAPEEKPVSNVIPLYDDPNKNLTADEIASLFASYGK